MFTDVFQRMGERLFPPPTAHLARMQHVSQLVMQHIRLKGRSEMFLTYSAEGKKSYLLRILTDMRVPLQNQPDIAVYFEHKFNQVGLLGELGLMLEIYDASHPMCAKAPSGAKKVSSAYVVAMLTEANKDTPGPVTRLMEQLNHQRTDDGDDSEHPAQEYVRHTASRRKAHSPSASHSQPQEVPLTDWSGLTP